MNVIVKTSELKVMAETHETKGTREVSTPEKQAWCDRWQIAIDNG